MPFHIRCSGDKWYVIQVDDLTLMFSNTEGSKPEARQQTLRRKSNFGLADVQFLIKLERSGVTYFAILGDWI